SPVVLALAIAAAPGPVAGDEAATAKQGAAAEQAGERAERGARAPARRPNFVVVMVDDQTVNTWNRQVMPKTFARLVDKGTLFTQAIATPPLCCPARAGFLTGRYP